MRSSEIREMSPEEMQMKLEDLQEELRSLRFGHVMQQVSNPLQIRSVRRDIARITTIIAERARESGGSAPEAATVEAVEGDEA
jgi:large subunit ribosomal protein L29